MLNKYFNKHIKKPQIQKVKMLKLDEQAQQKWTAKGEDYSRFRGNSSRLSEGVRLRETGEQGRTRSPAGSHSVLPQAREEHITFRRDSLSGICARKTLAIKRFQLSGKFAYAEHFIHRCQLFYINYLGPP